MKLNKSYFALLLVAVPMATQAQVTPTSGMNSPNNNAPLSMGWTVLATGGDVLATIMPFDFNGSPGYNNNTLYAGSPSGILIGTNYQFGQTVDLGTYQAGSEIIISMVSQPGQTYYSGSLGALNPDGKVHANVYSIGSTGAAVDFEDLASFQGSDWNYGDAKVVLTNAQAVPEPAPFLVLGAGLLGLVFRRRS